MPVDGPISGHCYAGDHADCRWTTDPTDHPFGLYCTCSHHRKARAAMSNTRRPDRARRTRPLPDRDRPDRLPEARRRAEDLDRYDDQEPTGPALAQEIEASDGHYVTASLCGESVRIIPPTAWRMSWQRMLRAGDIDGFAEEVLAPEDLDLFYELDPTSAEFEQFVTDAAELSGESLGKSAGPRRSSRSTRRR